MTVDGADITIGVEQASSRAENTEEQDVRYAEVVDCRFKRSWDAGLPSLYFASSSLSRMYRPERPGTVVQIHTR